MLVRDVLLTALLLVGGATEVTASDDSWRGWEQYTAGLRHECPQKHLELLPFGEIPDVIDAFRKRLSAAEWQKVRKAEADRCRDVGMGASCGNEGFLRVMIERKRLDEFVGFVCALPKSCTAQSECKQDR